MRYDADNAPDPQAWLQLDEPARIDLVIAYHRHRIHRACTAGRGRTGPLFQAIRYRAFGRGEAVLNGERLHRANAWTMVRRRAKAASITTEVCNHTFRGTGITAYLENGDTLQKAARLHKLQPRREPVSSMPEAISTAR